MPRQKCDVILSVLQLPGEASDAVLAESAPPASKPSRGDISSQVRLVSCLCGLVREGMPFCNCSSEFVLWLSIHRQIW